MQKTRFESATIFGVFAVVLAAFPAVACGGVPAYPQPVLESEVEFEAPELVAAKNALEADGFVCTPGASRPCERFEPSTGSCVKTEQPCAADGSGWMACGADPNGTVDHRMFDQADEDAACGSGGDVIVR